MQATSAEAKIKDQPAIASEACVETLNQKEMSKGTAATSGQDEPGSMSSPELMKSPQLVPKDKASDIADKAGLQVEVTSSKKDVNAIESDKASKSNVKDEEDPVISKRKLLRSLAKKPNRK